MWDAKSNLVGVLKERFIHQKSRTKQPGAQGWRFKWNTPCAFLSRALLKS
jgi:hypothetical protein